MDYRSAHSAVVIGPPKLQNSVVSLIVDLDYIDLSDHNVVAGFSVLRTFRQP